MLRHGAIIVHGGAGDLDAADVEGAREGCEHAVRSGFEVLRAGGSALDAVELAVRILEDDERFNAGRGACLTREGTVELDAAIMMGDGLRTGAVGSVRGVKNPVTLARRVMEDAEHVLIVGDGAAAFAREANLDLVPAEFHVTDRARRNLARELGRRRVPAEGAFASEAGGGTVGAVAVDGAGHVAAATSTGGMVGKRCGRIGDTPLPGCGTYADDLAGAASATGHGERIIQVVMAKSAVERLRAGESAPAAAAAAIADLGARVRGEGGIIVVDRQGRLGFARNTRHMAFAYVVDGSDAVSGV